MDDKTFEKLQVQPIAAIIAVSKLPTGVLSYQILINSEVSSSTQILQGLIDHLNRLGEMQREKKDS